MIKLFILLVGILLSSDLFADDQQTFCGMKTTSNPELCFYHHTDGWTRVKEVFSERAVASKNDELSDWLKNLPIHIDPIPSIITNIPKYIDSLALSGVSTTKYPAVGMLLRNNGVGKTRTSCTGTLIAPKVVLTAAHCFFIPSYSHSIRQRQEKYLSSKFTSKNYEVDRWKMYLPSSGLLGIDEVIINPGFSAKWTKIYLCDSRETDCEKRRAERNISYINDLALVILSEPVHSIVPAKINIGNDGVSSFQGFGTVVGYGKATENSASDSQIKRFGYVTAISCDGLFELSDSAKDSLPFLCTNYRIPKESNIFPKRSRNKPVIALTGEEKPKATDPCSGDSGGPLLDTYKVSDSEGYETAVTAVLSGGFSDLGESKCTSTEFDQVRTNYSVYTKLTDEVEKWINSYKHKYGDPIVVQQPAWRLAVQGEFFQPSVFESDHPNYHLFKLVMRPDEDPSRLRVTLNGEKGLDKSVLESSENGLFLLKHPFDIDIQVVRHRFLVASNSFPEIFSTASAVGEGLFMQAKSGRSRISSKELVAFKTDNSLIENRKYWDIIEHGTDVYENRLMYEPLLDCNADGPGNIAECEVSTETDVNDIRPPVCDASWCTNNVWYFIIRNNSGVGSYQLTITPIK